MILVLADGAANAAKGGAQGFQMIVVLVMMLAIFYFMIIRPNQKAQKKHRDLVDSLQPGAEVIAAGGLIGKVTAIKKNNFIILEIAEGVEIVIRRDAVAAILPRDTIDNIISDE